MNVNRTLLHSPEWHKASTPGSFFLAPLMYLMHMEQMHVPDDRRRYFRETPPWFLFFKNRYYQNAQEFVHQTLSVMMQNETLAKLSNREGFHTETGILTRHLVEYLRSIDDADKIMNFISSFRSYILGEKKRMPRNISNDKNAYKNLKNVVGTEYTQRLIGEYKAGSSPSKTQDFVVLFKMPLFALLETVFCSMDDEDIVSAIEEYRL